MNLPFILGTAQFGSHYGITNKDGRPSIDDIHDIIQSSLDEGIHFFDTAFGYGDSLNLIGNFRTKKSNTPIYIISKFSVLSDVNDVYKKIVSYLKKTNLPRFYGLLIHDPENI